MLTRMILLDRASHVHATQMLPRLSSVSARKMGGYGGIILYHAGERNFRDARCIAKIIDITLLMMLNRRSVYLQVKYY